METGSKGPLPKIAQQGTTLPALCLQLSAAEVQEVKDEIVKEYVDKIIEAVSALSARIMLRVAWAHASHALAAGASQCQALLPLTGPHALHNALETSGWRRGDASEGEQARPLTAGFDCSVGMRRCAAGALLCSGDQCQQEQQGRQCGATQPWEVQQTVVPVSHKSCNRLAWEVARALQLARCSPAGNVIAAGAAGKSSRSSGNSRVSPPAL